MLYALGWMVVLLLLALWSLTVWGLHAVGVWAVSNAGSWTGGAGGIQTLRLPEWLAPWVPPEITAALGAMLSDLAPAIEALLQQAPALAGGLTVAAWVVWGFGSLLLVGLGAVGHGLVAVLRRRGARMLQRPAGAATAG